MFEYPLGGCVELDKHIAYVDMYTRTGVKTTVHIYVCGDDPGTYAEGEDGKTMGSSNESFLRSWDEVERWAFVMEAVLAHPITIVNQQLWDKHVKQVGR
jgi:hypothetical protein